MFCKLKQQQLYLAKSMGRGPIFLSSEAQSPPSTYSITIHRCFFVSKLHHIPTTNGFSANVKMSLSANTCCTLGTGQPNIRLLDKLSKFFVEINRSISIAINLFRDTCRQTNRPVLSWVQILYLDAQFVIGFDMLLCVFWRISGWWPNQKLTFHKNCHDVVFLSK